MGTLKTLMGALLIVLLKLASYVNHLDRLALQPHVAMGLQDWACHRSFIKFVFHSRSFDSTSRLALQIVTSQKTREH